LLFALTPSAPNRCRVVFGSEEKENIDQSFRMGRVEVVDDEYHREGTEVGQPFSTCMRGINQQLAALAETNALQNQQLAAQIQTNALQNQRIASLTERSNEYAGRLDDAARAHNELQDTINQIRQRNADLTIDQGAIDVLMRAHDFAMCPLCNQRYRATFCFPCMYTVCSD
jgi:hypothetical protein